MIAERRDGRRFRFGAPVVAAVVMSVALALFLWRLNPMVLGFAIVGIITANVLGYAIGWFLTHVLRLPNDGMLNWDPDDLGSEHLGSEHLGSDDHDRADPQLTTRRWRKWPSRLLAVVLMLAGGLLLAAMLWGFVGLLDRNWDTDTSASLIAAMGTFVVAFALLVLLDGRSLWRRTFTLRQLLLTVVLLAAMLASGRVLLIKGSHQIAMDHWRSKSLTDYDLLYLREEFFLNGCPPLKGPGITDVSLERIGSLPNIHSLTLIGTAVTDDGLKWLLQCDGLVHLDLMQPDISDVGLKYIAQLRNLESLDLQATRVTDDGMRLVSRMPCLWDLSLPAQIGDAGFAALGDCPSLKSLDARGTQIGDQGLRSLANCGTLESLYVSQTGITDAGLRQIPRFRSLRTLDLRGVWQLSDAGIEHLADARQLESLCLSGCNVGDQGLKSLVRLAALRSLDLSGCNVGDEGLKSLERLSALRSLNLNNTKVTDVGVDHLRNLRELHFLSLTGTAVSDRGLQFLRELDKLEYLSLPVGLNDRVLGILKEMKQLKFVGFKRGGVSPAAMREFKEALPSTDIQAR